MCSGPKQGLALPASVDLEKIFDIMSQKSDRGAGPGGPASPFSEITDDDIDALFGD